MEKLSPIQRAYLRGLDARLTGETLVERRHGESVMNGALPFLLAEQHTEHLLDDRARRARLDEIRALPRPLEPIARLLSDL